MPHIWDDWPRPPEWKFYRSHRPPSKKCNWSRIIDGTHDDDARYHFDLPQTVESLEWQCFNQGISNPERFQCRRGGNEDTAIFWMECSFITGASDGHETKFMLLKWQKDNTQTTIHGYPVTENELKTKYGINP